MKIKNEKIESTEYGSVKEPVTEYMRKEPVTELTQMISHKIIDSECFTLEESKSRVVGKIHRHFHRQ